MQEVNFTGIEDKIPYNLIHLKVLVNFLPFLFLCILFFKDFIYLFLERGEGWEKERERNINAWTSLVCPPTGDLARNPGMCPDQNRTGDPLVCMLALNPLSYTSQGLCILFIRNYDSIGKLANLKINVQLQDSS